MGYDTATRKQTPTAAAVGAPATSAAMPSGRLLALARDLRGYLHGQAARHWRAPADARPTRDLFGKTLLVLGVGAFGGHLARLAQTGLGMSVLGLARTRLDHPNVDRYIARHELH